MGFVGKRLKKLYEQTERNKLLPLNEAIQAVQKTANAKFGETVDLALTVRMPMLKKGQMLRGTAKLPSGTGKTVTIAAFAEGEEANRARAAGADFVGSADLVERIQKEGVFFDKCVASPSMMLHLGKIGKILGPKGVMPNPKDGTVAQNLAEAIQDLRGGQIHFRVDKGGVVHAGVGKTAFAGEALSDNIQAFIKSVLDSVSVSKSGQFIKSLHLSSTMGPSFKVDLSGLV